MAARSTRPCCARRYSKADRVHVAILSARSGWHTDELRRAVAARGHTCTVAPYQGIAARIGGGAADGVRVAADTEPPHVVLARIIPSGSLEQIIFRIDALHWLEDRGIPVINSPRAIERTVDKFWTSSLLEQCGIPTPETVVCESADEAFAAFRLMGD